MRTTEARKHAEHGCTVFSNWTSHTGIIQRVMEHPADPMAYVSGEPNGRWLYVAELSTTCVRT